MAYQTYITEAIVCGYTDNQNADRSYLLFTREGGMIYAHAKSVREERSKQRYALQLCSHVRTTLIRGKSGWKIAGTEPIQNLYMRMETREARAALRNIIRLLRRVIHGETEYGNIFDDIVGVFSGKVLALDTKVETILALRILHALGYVAPKDPYSIFLHGPIVDTEVINYSDEDTEECRRIIDHALLASHL